MALPRAVQEAAEAADALAAELSGVTAPPGTPETTTPQPADTQTPPTVPQAVTPPVPAIPEETWEHRYSSLKGKFDAEVPRLHSQNRELRDQLTSMQSQISTMQAANQQPPEPPKRLITDQDREAFGQDLVGLVERGVKEATEPLQATIEKLKTENAILQSRIGAASAVATKTEQEQFHSALEREVPNIREVNVDPGFIEWLGQVDPIYGIPRRMALDNAADRKDVERTANIFKAYIATKAPAQPAPKNDLSKQVAPARSRSSAAPDGQGQKLMWTQQSIERFYHDVRRNVLTADEVARLEADLNAAIVEGRVQ